MISTSVAVLFLSTFFLRSKTKRIWHPSQIHKSFHHGQKLNSATASWKSKKLQMHSNQLTWDQSSSETSRVICTCIKNSHNVGSSAKLHEIHSHLFKSSWIIQSVGKSIRNVVSQPEIPWQHLHISSYLCHQCWMPYSLTPYHPRRLPL